MQGQVTSSPAPEVPGQHWQPQPVSDWPRQVDSLTPQRNDGLGLCSCAWRVTVNNSIIKINCASILKYLPGLGNTLLTLPNVRCVLKLDSDVSRLCSFKVNPVFRDSWNLQLPWNMLSLQLQLQVPLSYLFPVIPDRLGKYISFLMKHNIVFKWFISNCFQFLINSWFLNISLFVPYVSLKSLLPVQQKIHK